LPNLITLLRIGLVPVMAWLLASREYGAATGVFVAAGVSDWLDGLLARRFGLHTRFGALADPVADKLMVGATAFVLLIQGLLPWWLAVLVLSRDAGILVCALAVGRRHPAVLAPSLLGKLHTATAFVVLALAVGDAAAGGLLKGWLVVAEIALAATTVASGVHYARRMRAGRGGVEDVSAA
jgi:cardiolipin synthase